MIIKSKIARISVIAILFMSVLWVATPRVYIHKLLNHNHELINNNNTGTSVKTEANDDCDFDNYDAPIYFTIFKFINNFIPLKPKQEAVLIHPFSNYNSFVNELDSSRAPPVA